MNHLVLIALGGAAGASARHLVGQAALRWIGPEWPYGTLAVNILGGFFMGLLVGWIAMTGRPDATALRYTLGVGLLGGFTTFSAFSLEVVLMIERKQAAAAAGYAALSVAGAVAALFVGLMLARKAFA